VTSDGLTPAEPESTKVMKMHETQDIEVQGDEFEDQQAILKQIADDEAWAMDAERLDDEEQARFEARFPVVHGITLNGQPVRKNVENGEIVDDNGEPFNSCDALRIIDGVKDDPDDVI
jgi:hypothetical protein